MRQTRRFVGYERAVECQARLNFSIVDLGDSLSEKSGHHQLTRREQVMPVRPAARSDGFVRLFPRLDHHIRDEAARLPVGEMLTDERQDTLLALALVRRPGRDEGCRTGSQDGRAACGERGGLYL